MAQENIGKLHLTAAQKTAINDAIAVLLNTITAVSPNFVPGDRQKYGSINELNKLLVNKANDFAANDANLKSPDVDWAEFEADYADRAFADTKLNTLNSVVSLLEDFKIAHDYDNYQAALVDYQFAQYKLDTGDARFATKVNEYKQFFPRKVSDDKKINPTK
jgi:hypothetical protein